MPCVYPLLCGTIVVALPLPTFFTPYGSQRLLVLLVAGLGLPQWAWMPDPCEQPLMLVVLYA